MVAFPFREIERCRVSCEYGRLGKWSSGKHDGIDLISDGDKTVLSCTDGKVIRSGINPYYGEYIVIQLSEGRSLIYGHLLENSRKVGMGQSVQEGQSIGVMGNTGNSSGAHLHIELQRAYYKAGAVDNIAEFLGIENKVGGVKLRVVETTPIVPQWQIDACKQLCQRKNLDYAYWSDKVLRGDSITAGELFGLLNKVCN